jgi:hypothetical protein
VPVDDQGQRSFAKGTSSADATGQEFRNSGQRNPATATGARLTRIAGYDKSVVTFQQDRGAPRAELYHRLSAMRLSAVSRSMRPWAFRSEMKAIFSRACAMVVGSGIWTGSSMKRGWISVPHFPYLYGMRQLAACTRSSFGSFSFVAMEDKTSAGSLSPRASSLFQSSSVRLLRQRRPGHCGLHEGGSWQPQRPM